MKSEAESVKHISERRRHIDEEHGPFDLLLLAEFAHEQHGELRDSCLEQPHVPDFVRVRIDSSEQQVVFVVDLYHHLIHRDVIRRPVAARLWVGPLYPIVDGGPTPWTPNISRIHLIFEIGSSLART